MNKHCYKVIFNKNRNQMMAVAEIASSEGKHSQSQRNSTQSNLSSVIKSVAMNMVSFSVLLALGSASVQASAIHADPNAPKDQRPTVLQTANGLPQVNIQTPSKHGVSMNQYRQMDIGHRGAILNNSRKSTRTQLAGMVQGNPHLARGEAKVIVNQINSSKPSHLNGHIEIAGKRAELIMANPSGLNINGGGFINAAGVTLTTGKVNYNQDRIQGIDVNRGRITIDGHGLDTSQINYTRLLTTAAEINAKLWANDLSIVAGHNHFDADGQRKALANNDQNNNPRQPGVAIDTGLLGGMYSGKIYLIVTDKGDSVNIDGKIYSRQFHLSADGMLTTTGDIIASSDTDPANTSLHLNAREIHNSGRISSQGSTKISSNSLNNQGLMTSGGELSLSQQQLNNQRDISAGRLVIDSDHLVNSGHISQTGRQALNIRSEQVLNQTTGRIGRTNNDSTDDQGKPDPIVNPDHTNDSGRPTGGNNGNNVTNGNNSTPDSNLATAIVLADGHISVRNIDNSGQIDAGGDINLKSHNLTNQGQVTVNSFNLSGERLDNQHGQINAGRIEINSRQVNNQHGQISANNQLHINGQKINNQQGKLQAGDELRLQADSIDNSNHGIIGSHHNLTLNSSQLNNQQGQIWAGGHTHLSTEQLNNQQGSIGSNQNLTLNSHQLNNQEGKLQAGGHFSLQSEQIDNSNHGIIGSHHNLTLNSNKLNNQQGQLWAGGQLTLSTNDLINQSGTIDADSMWLNAGNIHNQQGAIRTNQTLNANISQQLNNQQGQLSSAKDLSVQGNQLSIDNSNQGKILAGQNLSLTAKSLTNQGTISAGQDATLQLTDDFSIEADLSAGHDLNLSSQGNITNHSNISANHNVSISAANIDNHAEGTIQSNNQTHLSGDNLINRGLINSNGTTLIEAKNNLTNIGTGRIYGDHIALQAETLTNREESINGQTQAASIAARQRLDIGAQHIINQEHALISSSGDLAIGGRLDQNHHATGLADSLINGSGRIEATGNGNIAVHQLQNLNNHFSVEEYLASTDRIQQYQESGNPEIWVHGQDGKFKKERKKLTFTFNDGSKKTWSKYNVSKVHWWDFERQTYRQRVTESDPGQIIIGGHLHISGDNWLNHNSQIIVGGDLTSDSALNLENRETKGQQRIEDNGKQGGYKYKNPKLGKGKIKTTNQKKYQQTLTTSHDFDSPVSIVQQHSATDHTGQTQAASVNSVQQSAQGAQNGQTNQSSHPPLISTLQPQPIKLPDNSLYAIKPDNSGYLIETDPAFTNQKQWLGSDYMLRALGQDPQKMQKRLGDGYYEQQLMLNQIIQLSGQRYLEGYDNNLEQYKALMNAGIEYAQAFNLTPGIALSAEQMSRLTSNIVWLENQTVTLPDGSRQTVLVPKVYLVAANTRLTPDGALISANNISLQNTGHIDNQGSINANHNLSLGAQTISNSGQISGNNLNLTASNQINFNGGVAVAKDNLSLKADHINLNSTTVDYGDNKNGGRLVDKVAGVYVTGEVANSSTTPKDSHNNNSVHGLLSIDATHDLNSHGATLSNQSKNGTTQLISREGDINLSTVSEQQHLSSGRTQDKNHWINHYQSETGTQINTNSDLNLISGHNINIRQSDLNSDHGTLNLNAGNNINIEAGRQQTELDHSVYIQTNSLTSKKTRLDQHQAKYNEAIGSNLSAANISLTSGHDIKVEGSNIVSDNGTQLMAGNDINLTVADNHYRDRQYRKTTKSGLMGAGGGIGFSIGKEKDTIDNTTTSLLHSGTMVGSLDGNTSITAGHHYNQSGSSVLAPQGDINIAAQQINVTAAIDTHQNDHIHTYQKSGFTVAVNAPVVSAVQKAAHAVHNIGESKNSRVNAMASANAAYDSYKAAQSLSDLAANPTAQNTNISLSLTYGQQKSKEETHSQTEHASASQIHAGGQVHLSASGAGKDSNITIIGSDISGEKSTHLSADNHINLLSAEQHRSEHSKNSASGFNAGIAASYGQNGFAFGVTAGGNYSKGHGNGEDNTHRHSHIGSSSGHTTLHSGGDTTISGAQVTGNSIKLDAANLNIASVQDTSKYHSNQTNISADVTVGYGASGSVDYSHSKINADYAAVTQQSGLLAGDGGYQINVSGHTQLSGALITSTDQAEQNSKNQITTGTIGFSNIHNHSDYKGESFGIGIGGSLSSGSGSIGFGHDKGHNNSTTHSGINTDNITLTKPDEQKQNISDLHTSVTTDNYTEHAGYIGNNFDKDRVQHEIDKQREITQEFSQNTQQAQTEINKKKEQLKEQIKNETNPAKLNEYQNQLDNWNTAGWLLGSISAGLSAPTNNLGGVIAAAVSPSVAHAIGDYFHNHNSEDSAAHLLAHAALGAAVAAAGGNNALVGAVSAAGAEAAAPALAHWLYGKDAADLTTDEKQTISSIIGLAGAAVGASTGNAADVTSGSQLGQNAVDNNYLSEHQQQQYGKELMQCKGDWCRVKVNGKWQIVNSAQQASLTAGIVSGIPIAIGESLEQLIDMATSPVETYNAIKSLINSGDILGNISAALKQEYSKRINNLIAEYEKAGASGSYNAGVEIGKLLTDIGTLAAGGIGAGKGVAQGIGKVVDKVADKLVNESMHMPELAGVGNIKLPSDTLADAAPAVNKKPAGADKPVAGAGNTANQAKQPATVHEVPGNIYNQQAVKQLENGQLPGYSTGGKTGVPREMAPSSNPNAMAEDFVKQYAQSQKQKLPKPRNVGTEQKPNYIYDFADGTKINYRPGGSSSNKTSDTTATVEINSSKIRNLNYNSKQDKYMNLKLKFPRKTEVKK